MPRPLRNTTCTTHISLCHIRSSAQVISSQQRDNDTQSTHRGLPLPVCAMGLNSSAQALPAEHVWLGHPNCSSLPCPGVTTEYKRPGAATLPSPRLPSYPAKPTHGTKTGARAHLAPYAGRLCLALDQPLQFLEQSSKDPPRYLNLSWMLAAAPLVAAAAAAPSGKQHRPKSTK